MAYKFVQLDDATGRQRAIEGTTGGNGAADAGKPALYDGSGSLGAKALNVSNGGVLQGWYDYISWGIEDVSGSGFKGDFLTDILTANRSWKGPDASGTFALESTLATEQATTSGTSKDFTGIPAGTKRITVMFVGVSTNGTSNLLIQLGDSGGIETTGYWSEMTLNNAGSSVTQTSTAGFVVNSTGGSSFMYGSVTFHLQDASDNRWVSSGVVTRSQTGPSQGGVACCAGSKALSAVLDRVRITTANGTDAFDAGVVSIQYSK